MLFNKHHFLHKTLELWIESLIFAHGYNKKATFINFFKSCSAK